MKNDRKIVSVESIAINPEFQKVLVEKAQREYTDLKEDIRVNGIRDSLVIGIIDDKEYVVDGHNRRQICIELGIKDVPIIEMHFANRYDAQMWILRNQLMRRNLNSFQRVEAALQFKDYFSAMAKENQRAAGGAVPANLQEAVDTYEELAKIANSSATNVRKVEKILRLANRKEIAALRNGDARISINSVYQNCTGKKSPTDKTTPKPKAKTPRQIPANRHGNEGIEVTGTSPTDVVTESISQSENGVEESLSEVEQLGDDEVFAFLDAVVENKSSEDRYSFFNRMSEWMNGWNDNTKVDLPLTQE